MRSFSPERSSVPVLEIAADDAAYPIAFHELDDPPARVYTRGTFAVAEPPAVAIVGTRNATPYGLRMARSIATACAHAGICVVSGLARGIDGAAHEAALAADGRTVAVLGTGPDVPYPPRHRDLQERIATHGLLISEFAPGSTGHGGAFPQRNRLIAALAQATIIVEAPEKSGALYTATFAAELGRKLAIVPNAVDVPNARGSNALLRSHNAIPILGADDVLALLDIEARPPHRPVVNGDAAHVWDAIQLGADTPAMIAARTGLALAAIQSALGLLEIDGLVHFDAAGRIRSALA
jgi:DNA processing protein